MSLANGSLQKTKNVGKKLEQKDKDNEREMKLDQFQNSNLWIKRVLETIYGYNGREDIINEMIQEHFSEMKGL